MPRIVSAQPLEEYRVAIAFDDGVQGVVNLSTVPRTGVFALWNDDETFRAVTVGRYGELAWGEAIDLCPDALYLEITGKSAGDLFPKLNSGWVDA